MLKFMFEGPISNNKEKMNITPFPLGRPWPIFFVEFLRLIWKL